jgi:hypothetical protein
VKSCPPDTADLTADRCASEGEPCALSALSKADVGDCCEGLVCDLDGAGVFRCRDREASEADAVLACRQASASRAAALELTSEVRTSQGDIPAKLVGSSGVVFRADGSLEQVTLHLFKDGSLACELSITAAADGSDTGTLAITAMSVRGFPCGLRTTEDYQSKALDQISGMVSLEMLAHCEGTLDGLCMNGKLTIEVGGRVPSSTGKTSLFLLAPIVIEGSLCSQ